MPELPDLTIYRERLEALLAGEELLELAIRHPFLVRTIEPAPSEAVGRRLEGVGRVGKRLVLHFEGELHVALHLMIAGRLRWRAAGDKTRAPAALASFRFAKGTLILSEAGTQRRASLHVLQGENAWKELDRGGIEVLEADLPAFRAALQSERRTLKRALTDPRFLSGIGNSYSDEILHAARLSPLRLTDALDDEEWSRLYDAAQSTLRTWIAKLRAEVGDGFPEKVTAFREGMAVHGRFGKPCPVCGSPVQRIRYASNECNYCARCQNAGRILADRSLSRLLKDDWPRTLEELEERRLPPPRSPE